MVDSAEIKIWGELVGAVKWDERRQLASFQYASNFIKKKWDLSPIKMPLKGDAQIMSFPDLSGVETFWGLPGLLADALPDMYGNALIETWLAQRGRPPESMNPVEKLCFIGTRGMGALEFIPTMFKGVGRTDSIEIDGLVYMAQKMLHKRGDFSTNIDENEKRAMLDILKIGTSAGGARPKAIIAYNKVSGEVRSGQADAPNGFEHYLIKLDGVSDVQFGKSQGYGRVEMAYYEMAKACEIDMTECQLLEENGRAHFLTQRFDREAGGVKHHIQTWCAMEHKDYNRVNHFSYEQLFQTMRILRLSYPEAEQLFRRMVFNVLAKNCDDHTKNFAFRLKKDAEWELAPAYDVCFAYRPDSVWVSQHALSVNGKRTNITKDDMLALASLVNVRNAEAIILQVKAVVSRWNAYAEAQQVDAKLRELIASSILPAPSILI